MFGTAPRVGAQAEFSDSLGGDIPPLRTVADPYPTFGGMAVDPENNRLLIGDENRKSLLLYDRLSGSRGGAVTAALRQILGPQTGIGFLGGVEMDPARREIYALNNDIEDRMVVFDYEAQGNAKPKRMLYVPHQAWGVSLNRARDELAISVQALGTVAVYRREATRLDAPLRIIRGLSTGWPIRTVFSGMPQTARLWSPTMALCAAHGLLLLRCRSPESCAAIGCRPISTPLHHHLCRGLPG